MTTVFIEQQIIEAVKRLLDKRVNEIFSNWEIVVPVIECGNIGGMYAVTPVVSLSGCERTEKERLIRLDAYSVSIAFTLQEHEDGELFCYAYSTAFAKALGEDVTLGGVVDRAVITGKKYTPPKKQNCGEGWGLVITLRVTVEGMAL
jgi:hypothetical protein